MQQFSRVISFLTWHGRGEDHWWGATAGLPSSDRHCWASQQWHSEKVVKAISGQRRSPLHGQRHGLLLLDRYKGYGELMRNVFEEP